MRWLLLVTIVLFACFSAFYLGRSSIALSPTEHVQTKSLPILNTASTMDVLSNITKNSDSSIGINPKITKSTLSNVEGLITCFNSFSLSDTEYKQWERSENEKNAPFFAEIIKKRDDLNGDGIITPKEKKESERKTSIAVGDATQKTKGLLEAAFDENGDTLISKEERKALDKAFSDNIRKKRDEIYNHFKYNAKTNEFPPNERYKMCEHILNNIGPLLSEVAKETSSARLGL